MDYDSARVLQNLRYRARKDGRTFVRTSEVHEELLAECRHIIDQIDDKDAAHVVLLDDILPGVVEFVRGHMTVIPGE